MFELLCHTEVSTLRYFVCLFWLFCFVVFLFFQREVKGQKADMKVQGDEWDERDPVHDVKPMTNYQKV